MEGSPNLGKVNEGFTQSEAQLSSRKKLKLRKVRWSSKLVCFQKMKAQKQIPKRVPTLTFKIKVAWNPLIWCHQPRLKGKNCAFGKTSLWLVCLLCACLQLSIPYRTCRYFQHKNLLGYHRLIIFQELDQCRSRFGNCGSINDIRSADSFLHVRPNLAH